MAELEEGVVAMCEVTDGGVLVVMDPVISQVQDTGWSDVLVLSLNNMRIKSTLCDVLLVGKSGQTINAHATVLAAASTRFHELLHKSQSKVILNMPTVAGEVLQSVVDFVYQGSTKVAHAHLPELQKFASAFSMDNLFKACETSVSFTAGGGVATSTAVTSFESSVVGESGLSVMGDNDDLSSQTGENIDDSGYKIKNEPDAPVAAPITNARLTYDDDGDEAEPFAEPDDPETTSQPPAAPVMADNDDVEAIPVKKSVMRNMKGVQTSITLSLLDVIQDNSQNDSEHKVPADSSNTGEDNPSLMKIQQTLRNKYGLRDCSVDLETRRDLFQNAYIDESEKSGRKEIHNRKVKYEVNNPYTEGKAVRKRQLKDIDNNYTTVIERAGLQKQAHHGTTCTETEKQAIVSMDDDRDDDYASVLKRKTRSKGKMNVNSRTPKVPYSKKAYKCQNCGEEFPKKYLLKYHKEAQHPVVHVPKPYVCKVCVKGFRCRRSFLRHIRRKPCDEGQSWKDYKKPVKPKPPATLKQAPQASRPYSCKVCGKGMKCRSSFLNHIKKPPCDEGQDLRDYALKRGRPKQPPKLKETYVCEECGKSFSLRLTYNNHLHHHKGTAPYKCEHCGKGLFSQNSYDYHVESHQVSKVPDDEKSKFSKYVCDECGLSYREKSGLKVHKLGIHRKVKRYNCKLCNAKFLYSGGLDYHMFSHKGERTCVCEHCGKGFYQPQALKRHLRIHTGEKPYKCRHCGRAFNQNSSRKTHEKTHMKSLMPGGQTLPKQKLNRINHVNDLSIPDNERTSKEYKEGSHDKRIKSKGDYLSTWSNSLKNLSTSQLAQFAIPVPVFVANSHNHSYVPDNLNIQPVEESQEQQLLPESTAPVQDPPNYHIL